MAVRYDVVMKNIINNGTEAALEIVRTVPPIVLFMGGVVSVLSFAGLQLLEMLQNA